MWGKRSPPRDLPLERLDLDRLDLDRLDRLDNEHGNRTTRDDLCFNAPQFCLLIAPTFYLRLSIYDIVM